LDIKLEFIHASHFDLICLQTLKINSYNPFKFFTSFNTFQFKC